MNREIKFRAWDKSNQRFEWFFPTQTLDAIFGQSHSDAPINKRTGRIFLRPECDYVLQQYTGLKDKNGKEIYEGDIVEFHYFYGSLGENLGFVESEHTLIGVVRMGGFGYGLESISGQHWMGYTGYENGQASASFIELCAMSEGAVHEESFTVMGNEFENPELLNQGEKDERSVANQAQSENSNHGTQKTKLNEQQ